MKILFVAKVFVEERERERERETEREKREREKFGNLAIFGGTFRGSLFSHFTQTDKNKQMCFFFASHNNLKQAVPKKIWENTEFNSNNPSFPSISPPSSPLKLQLGC